MRRAAAWVAIAASAFVLVLLSALHLLSPEFDPSWRVVSEYANGHYGWVLSLMFATWAVGSWALACALWPILRGPVGRVGLWFLVAAGAGEALGAAFDINHPLHGLAGLLGAGGLPVAAMLITVSLRRSPSLSAGGTRLWLANLTWVMAVAMVGSLILLFVTFTHAGGHAPADGGTLPIGTNLPPGAVALVGFVNRLMVVINCLWVMVAADEWVLRRSAPARSQTPSEVVV